jgi:hypothetical protein
LEGLTFFVFDVPPLNENNDGFISIFLYDILL